MEPLMQFPAVVSQTRETGCRMPLVCCHVENPEEKPNPLCPERTRAPCTLWQCQEATAHPGGCSWGLQLTRQPLLKGDEN